MAARELSRRALLQGGGALLVGLALAPAAAAGAPHDPGEVDSYLTLHADGTGGIDGIPGTSVIRKTIDDIDFRSAMIIGAAQALALVPGTSRSGITMTAGRALGYLRPDAARFSFLLSIPATAAAGVLILGDALKHHQPIGLDALITGALTFVIALGTIAFLMAIIRRHSFLPFVVYRVLLGAVLLGLAYGGALPHHVPPG